MRIKDDKTRGYSRFEMKLRTYYDRTYTKGISFIRPVQAQVLLQIDQVIYLKNFIRSVVPASRLMKSVLLYHLGLRLLKTGYLEALLGWGLKTVL